jgi:hypothetical protein
MKNVVPIRFIFSLYKIPHSCLGFSSFCIEVSNIYVVYYYCRKLTYVTAYSRRGWLDSAYWNIKMLIENKHTQVM